MRLMLPNCARLYYSSEANCVRLYYRIWGHQWGGGRERAVSVLQGYMLSVLGRGTCCQNVKYISNRNYYAAIFISSSG